LFHRREKKIALRRKFGRKPIGVIKGLNEAAASFHY